jgi:hypothetical protein
MITSRLPTPSIVLDHAGDWLLATWDRYAVVITTAITLLAGLVIAWWWVRRVARRRWWVNARLVEVLAPADLDTATALAGGRRLWRDLTGLARPPIRRVLEGQPHLAIEYVLSHEQLGVRVWIPGTVPPHRVEAAIRAAWPGALIMPVHTVESVPPLVGTVTGGTVRPERGEHLPLHVPDPRDNHADPVRALEALGAFLGSGECGVVQVLARPAVGRRLRRYHATIRRLHTGRPARPSVITAVVTGVVRKLLDLITGRHTTRADRRWRPADPQRAEQLRDVRAKAALPQWEVAVRYAAATPDTGSAGRDRVRGIADGLFGMFAVLSGHNALARHRLRHPAAVLAARRLRRGALLSSAELAAIAHLPVRTTGLAGSRARSVPAPREVTGPSRRPA